MTEYLPWINQLHGIVVFIAGFLYNHVVICMYLLSLVLLSHWLDFYNKNVRALGAEMVNWEPLTSGVPSQIECGPQASTKRRSCQLPPLYLTGITFYRVDTNYSCSSRIMKVYMLNKKPKELKGIFIKEHTKHLLHTRIHTWPHLSDYFTKTSCSNHVKCIVTEVLILICWEVWTTVWARGIRACVKWVWSSFLENGSACVLSLAPKYNFSPSALMTKCWLAIFEQIWLLRCLFSL